jgi:integrase
MPEVPKRFQQRREPVYAATRQTSCRTFDWADTSDSVKTQSSNGCGSLKRAADVTVRIENPRIVRNWLEKARRSAEILKVVVTSPTKSSPDRRPYGSGRLFVRADKSGQESWYGSWWADGSRIKRKLGPKRPRGSSQGLTRSQAEAELRKRIAEVSPPSHSTGMKLADAISAYIEHLQQVRRRKHSTVQDYEIIARLHLVPFFGESVRIEKVSPDKVSAFIGYQRRARLAYNSIRNQTNFLHGVFGFSVCKGWVGRNPVDAIELPAAPSSWTKRIEFLTPREVGDLMEATTDDQMGRVDRALFMTAALTGLRMSELLALRWQDVDWVAGKIRVAEGFVRDGLTDRKVKPASAPSQWQTRLEESWRDIFRDLRFKTREIRLCSSRNWFGA